MPRIDTNIQDTDLSRHKACQAKTYKNETQMTLKIKEEKEYNVGFLKVVNYLELLANIVTIPKKEGKVCT